MDAMKKAQEFTSVAKDLQEQLKNTEIEASVRDGQVTVTMTAQQVPLNVVVSDDLVAKGSEEVSGDYYREFYAPYLRTLLTFPLCPCLTTETGVCCCNRRNHCCSLQEFPIYERKDGKLDKRFVPRVLIL